MTTWRVEVGTVGSGIRVTEVMIVLVTGAWEWTDYAVVEAALKTWKATAVVEGECSMGGADLHAREAAKKMSLGLFPHPADWKRYGKKAGMLRNQEMLDAHPDIEMVLAFHDDLSVSRGTLDMIRRAMRAGLRVVHYSHGREPNLLV